MRLRNVTPAVVSNTTAMWSASVPLQQLQEHVGKSPSTAPTGMPSGRVKGGRA